MNHDDFSHLPLPSEQAKIGCPYTNKGCTIYAEYLQSSGKKKIANKNFTSVSSFYVQHIIEHHSGFFLCSLLFPNGQRCNQRFFTWSNFKAHQHKLGQSAHSLGEGTKVPVQCEDCGGNFRSKDSCRMHRLACRYMPVKE